MAPHNEMGKWGEELAKRFLTRRGYAILHQNWRYRHYEIDIIAVKGKALHFIEVKTRSSVQYGLPEAGVTKKKLLGLLQAAEAYLLLYGRNQPAQYDVVSIILAKNKTPEFFLIEDVFI